MITLSTKLLLLLQKLCILYLSTESARLAEQEHLAAGDIQGICMSITLRRNSDDGQTIIIYLLYLLTNKLEIEQRTRN